VPVVWVVKSVVCRYENFERAIPSVPPLSRVPELLFSAVLPRPLPVVRSPPFCSFPVSHALPLPSVSRMNHPATAPHALPHSTYWFHLHYSVLGCLSIGPQVPWQLIASICHAVPAYRRSVAVFVFFFCIPGCTSRRLCNSSALPFVFFLCLLFCSALDIPTT